MSDCSGYSNELEKAIEGAKTWGGCEGIYDIHDPATFPTIESNPYFNEFVARHAEWTEATFGPGLRTKGITSHIRKELIEIENEPTKLEEWIDVILLALDGARRTGANGTQIMQELERKLSVCQERVYPFPESEDHASEHVRSVQ